MTTFYKTLTLLLCLIALNGWSETPLLNSDFTTSNNETTNNVGESVGDFVFKDNNGNGIQDIGEEGISGILVVLTNQDNGSIKFAISKSTGKYLFFDIEPGTYTLKFPAQITGFTGTNPNQGNDDTIDSDFDPATGMTPEFTLVVNETNFDMDAGYVPQSGPCSTDADNDGVCFANDCDDNNASIGAKQIAGTSCDDGNATTINDIIQADGCTCTGTPDSGCTDTDNDGICVEDDCNDNDANIGANQTPNTSCDDGNAATINDVIQADGCTCAGTPDGENPDCEAIAVATSTGKITVSGLTAPITIIKVFDKNSSWSIIFECNNNCSVPVQMIDANASDYNVHIQFYDANWSFICEKRFDVTVDGSSCTDADNDGVCVADDCNDNDANIGTKQAQGTPCDDGNAATMNDIIQADGCTCTGTPDGENPDCEAIAVTTNSEKITVSGLTAPVIIIKVFDKNTGWSIIFECTNNCTVPVQMIDVNAGDYNIHIQFYDANWGFICEKRFDVIVDGDNCTDADNDGVCVADDCNDNDANIGAKQTQGTSCNDDNVATINDVIQADGCTCAGTPDSGNHDCETIVITPSVGKITISNLTAPIIIIRVYDKNEGWTNTFYCSDTCNMPVQIINTPASNYDVHVQFYDAQSGYICGKHFDVTVPRGDCTDADNDGICMDDDCNDNDPTIGIKLAPGHFCDDGNVSTINDQIQEDSCTCEGTLVVTHPSCEAVTVTEINEEIIVSGLTAPIVSIKVFTLFYGQLLFECFNDCNVPQQVIPIPQPGASHHVVVQLYDANWTPLCEKRFLIFVTPNASNRSAPLLNLVAFPAERQIDLQWVTNTTYKNDYYLIEKSTDGKNFEAVDKVINTKNTDEASSFSSQDASPILGTNYYRVKQVYIDGTFEYTDIKMVNYTIDLKELAIFPNPAQEALFINLKQYIGRQANIKIVNQYGQVMKNINLPQVTTDLVKVNLNKFQNGLYYISIDVEKTSIVTKKILVNRMY